MIKVFVKLQKAEKISNKLGTRIVNLLKKTIKYECSQARLVPNPFKQTKYVSVYMPYALCRVTRVSSSLGPNITIYVQNVSDSADINAVAFAQWSYTVRMCALMGDRAGWSQHTYSANTFVIVTFLEYISRARRMTKILYRGSLEYLLKIYTHIVHS